MSGRPDNRQTAAQRGYGYRWQKARKTFLQRNPLCRLCQQRGRITAATVVDHIIPHKQDQSLFWNTLNWQSLCKPCHDGAKQSVERTGRRPGCDVNGMPLDPDHRWNK